MQNQPNTRFKNYANVFKNLVKQSTVTTLFPIVSIIITYDSQRAVTVTKRNDEEYWIKQYSLETYELTFQEMIGCEDQIPRKYIKIKEVEQSPTGKQFAICYNDDGHFYIRWFSQVPDDEELERFPSTIENCELYINLLIGLDANNTICHQHFPDPFVTCTFINEEILYVDLYENFSKTHYHFFYNIINHELIGTIA